jgi:ferrous iron transport protein B
LIILSIYLIGILISILTALLLKNTKFKGESEQFVMELPPYRVPSTRNVLVHMWDKSVQYLKKMGSVILVASIIIWLLNYFPTTNSKMEAIDNQIAQTEQSVSIDKESKQAIIAQLEIDKAAAQSEYSYIGRIGKFIAPVVQPLGFDWQMGVSLLTGLAAKEIIVSSMGILYNADTEADESSEKLTTALQTHLGPDGKPFLTPLKAYVYMIFVLLCFPCVAAISAIAKEANWRWAGFTMIYTTSIAWIISFLVYNIGLLLI